jgi:hypothetical protein
MTVAERIVSMVSIYFVAIKRAPVELGLARCRRWMVLGIGMPLAQNSNLAHALPVPPKFSQSHLDFT